MRVGFAIQNTERYRSWRTLWRWRTREPIQSMLAQVLEGDGVKTLHVTFSARDGAVYIEEFWLSEGRKS